jgi:hypothetical protein
MTRKTDVDHVKTDLPLHSIRILNRPPSPSELGYRTFARQMGKAGPKRSTQKQ